VNWQRDYIQELNQAANALNNGNEGMARVCARRACGTLIGEYLRQQKIAFQSPSAYQRIKYLADLPNVSEQVREIANHFLVHVLPDHKLPLNVDLLTEVRTLENLLLPDEVIIE